MDLFAWKRQFIHGEFPNFVFTGNTYIKFIAKGIMKYGRFFIIIDHYHLLDDNDDCFSIYRVYWFTLSEHSFWDGNKFKWNQQNNLQIGLEWTHIESDGDNDHFYEYKFISSSLHPLFKSLKTKAQLDSRC